MEVIYLDWNILFKAAYTVRKAGVKPDNFFFLDFL